MIKVTLRGPAELTEKLETEATRKGLSVNALTISILHRHVTESRRDLARIG